MNEGMEGCSAGGQRGGGRGEPVREGGLGRRKVGENTEKKTTCLGKRNICVFFSPKTSEAANFYLKGERGYIQAAHWALSAAPKGSMRVGGVGVWTLEPAPCRNRPPPSWDSLPGPPFLGLQMPDFLPLKQVCPGLSLHCTPKPSPHPPTKDKPPIFPLVQSPTVSSTSTCLLSYAHPPNTQLARFIPFPRPGSARPPSAGSDPPPQAGCLHFSAS